VKSSALCADRPLPPERFLVLISVRIRQAKYFPFSVAVTLRNVERSYSKLSHAEFCKDKSETQKQETGHKANIKKFLKVGLNCAVHSPE
jgi:hypothetical protein